ncbi:MAG TPA: hypothetical protein VLF59_03565 [Candidatus Saccharimonadales bacterium]|nr:hypothetical protein [Candidatus Saccharimonadales bacterium]
MSQEPLHVTDTVEPVQDPSWESLAEQIDTIHPALRAHVEHNLAIRGIQAAHTNTREVNKPATVDKSPQQPAAGSHEKKGGQESSAESIAEAFADAQNSVYKLSADPRLHRACEKRGIDPYDDVSTPGYWRTVSEFGRERIARIREQHGDSLKLQALELMVTTPEYLFAQSALRRGSGYRQTAEGRRDRDTTIGFNDQLRDFATKYPELRANKVSSMMLTMANMSIEDKDVRQAASQTVLDVVRGARYELGFGQLLAAGGRKFRKGTAQEDGKGTDYIVEGTGGRELHVDAKASLYAVEEEGSKGVYAIRRDGRITMYALLRDYDFRGGFFVPEELAAERGEALNHQLDMAERELLGVA